MEQIFCDNLSEKIFECVFSRDKTTYTYKKRSIITYKDESGHEKQITGEVTNFMPSYKVGFVVINDFEKNVTKISNRKIIDIEVIEVMEIDEKTNV